MKIEGLCNDGNEMREKIESEGRGVEVACVDEVVVGDGDRGAKVELDGIVELVGVDVVDLHYIKVAVRGEAVKDLVEELGVTKQRSSENAAWNMVWEYVHNEGKGVGEGDIEG
ncbi:hypothetical protein HN51_069410 [Arachis hypogaea]